MLQCEAIIMLESRTRGGLVEEYSSPLAAQYFPPNTKITHFCDFWTKASRECVVHLLLQGCYVDFLLLLLLVSLPKSALFPLTSESADFQYFHKHTQRKYVRKKTNVGTKRHKNVVMVCTMHYSFHQSFISRSRTEKRSSSFSNSKRRIQDFSTVSISVSSKANALPVYKNFSLDNTLSN